MLKIIRVTKGEKQPLFIIIYGRAGVGKTFFATSFPRTLILDFEQGTKFTDGTTDIIRFNNWLPKEDKKELTKLIENYDTIVIDSLTEAMNKLIDSNHIRTNKDRQPDGTLTKNGWGVVKKEMRSFLTWLKESGKNIIVITHVHEDKDDDMATKSPQVATGLSEEILNMADIIVYLYLTSLGDRRGCVKPSSAKLVSKDRTQKLAEIIEEPSYKEFKDLIYTADDTTDTTDTADTTDDTADEE